MKDRRYEMDAFLVSNMEEIFQESCKMIQNIYDSQTFILYNEFENNLLNLFRDCNNKEIFYIAISSLVRGRRCNKWEFVIEAMDNNFYLDENISTVYYTPLFLHPILSKDINKLFEILHKNFIRIQSYELDYIANKYILKYESIMKNFIQDIILKILNSNNVKVKFANNLKVLYGKYMCNYIIIYEGDLNRNNNIYLNQNTFFPEKSKVTKIMKYYLLSTDEGNLLPRIKNVNTIKIKNLNQQNLQRIPMWNLVDMDAEKECAFVDMLDYPYFAVSKEFLGIIELYDKIEYRCMKLYDKNSDVNFTYFLPIIMEIDCLSEKSEWNQSRSFLKKIVIKEDEIIERALFRLKGLTRPHVIARLDLVELLVRRNALGIKYSEIETV